MWFALQHPAPLFLLLSVWGEYTLKAPPACLYSSFNFTEADPSLTQVGPVTLSAALKEVTCTRTCEHLLPWLKGGSALLSAEPRPLAPEGPRQH